MAEREFEWYRMAENVVCGGSGETIAGAGAGAVPPADEVLDYSGRGAGAG